MGFTDEYGCPAINDEHKLRIPLSTHAEIIISQDMELFNINKKATFINTVFANYKDKAQSSISIYLQNKRADYEQLFATSKLDDRSKDVAIGLLLANEEQSLREKYVNIKFEKSTSILYHINNDNYNYLVEETEENNYYNRIGQYVQAVIEEYCSLPFILREEIIKRDAYKIVRAACKNKTTLRVKVNVRGKNITLTVYPYKIVPDAFHTQSYLVCYSHHSNEPKKTMGISSFSMAKLSNFEEVDKESKLSKDEIKEIEDRITNNSVAYLLETPDKVTVKLTPAGRRAYLSRMYSRPDAIVERIDEDTYVFQCPHQQIYDYFFSFGANAEIISPPELRERFKSAYNRGTEVYR